MTLYRCCWNAQDVPAASLIGARVTAPGQVSMTPGGYHYNPLGTVHGGVIATLLDMAMADAVARAVPPGSHPVRLEQKVNYIRGVTEAAGVVQAMATLTQAGRRVAAATAQLTDAGGRVYATGSATFLVTGTAAAAAGLAGTREVDWSDPRAIARDGMRQAGLDFLQRMQRGDLPPPPVLVLLGIAMAEISPARVTMALPCAPHLTDGTGHIEGGMVNTMIDSVMGCAVHSTLPAGRGYTTVELRTSFLRPIGLGDGPVTATGTVLHAGHQMALAEARAVDAAGHLVATALSTCLLFDLPTGS